MTEVTFYHDFGSPNAYLVHKALPGLLAPLDAELRYMPMLLGGVFKETGNQPPLVAFAQVKGKTDYIRTEFARFVERYAVPFHWNPHFPVNTLALMRGAIFAQGKPWEAEYIDVCYDAVWSDGQDMSDSAVISRVLGDAGLPADEILAATQLPDVKGRLASLTDEAVERGIFGAPTCFLGNEMFFGKDALDDLIWRLQQQGAG